MSLVGIDLAFRHAESHTVEGFVVKVATPVVVKGVLSQEVDGVSVRIYDPAKTVADCFKYRDKIGVDVALEALKEYRRQRGSTDELWRYAKVCRVTKVMQPYLEAMP